MTIEQRLDQLEKRNKRLTVALTMMVVAMCAVVTMAATGEKDADFDTLTARNIYVKDAVMAKHLTIGNKTGATVVTLLADEYGNGVVGAWNRV